eukprot:2880941-Rhodomonas_salina.3
MAKCQIKDETHTLRAQTVRRLWWRAFDFRRASGQRSGRFVPRDSGGGNGTLALAHEGGELVIAEAMPCNVEHSARDCDLRPAR